VEVAGRSFVLGLTPHIVLITTRITNDGHSITLNPVFNFYPFILVNLTSYRMFKTTSGFLSIEIFQSSITIKPTRPFYFFRTQPCELGATVQKTAGQNKERARGFVGYRIVEDRDNDYPF
jgi:hypothetical protein